MPGVLPGPKVYWLAPFTRLKAWPAVSQSTFSRLGVLYTLGTFFFPSPTKIGTGTPLTSQYSISARGSKVL